MPRKTTSQGVHVTPVEREPLTDETLDHIVEAALRRAALVGDLKSALLARDQPQIVAAARRVCGLPEESER
jgi:hypothetical protein